MAGTLKLVGTEEKTIYDSFSLLLDNHKDCERMSKANPYGDEMQAKELQIY